MNTKIPDDRFLSRWMNNELSSEEEKEWKAHKGYQEWQRIQHALERRALPAMEEEKVYQNLRENLPATGRVLRRINTRWMIAAAASVALLLTLLLFLYSPDNWQTPLATQQSVKLPDGSLALLNADTKLSFQKGLFSGRRSLKLEGEASFRVQPGKPFIVQTPLGKVRVLGTKFNVLGRAEQFEVFCTEGSVLVQYGAKEFQLKAGEGVNPLDNNSTYTHQKEEAEWTRGLSQFTNTPLPLVFDELERQYNIEVQHSGLSNRYYTGRFSHDDLDNALSVICGAMNLSFKFTEDNIVLIEPE